MFILRSNLRLPFDLTLINLGVTSFQDHSVPKHLPKISSIFRSRASKPSLYSEPPSPHNGGSEKPPEPPHSTVPDCSAQRGAFGRVPQKRPRNSRDSTSEIDGKKLVLARRDYKSEARANVLSKRAERALMDTQAGLLPNANKSNRPPASLVLPKAHPSHACNQANVMCNSSNNAADHTATVHLGEVSAQSGIASSTSTKVSPGGVAGQLPSTATAPESVVPTQSISQKPADVHQEPTTEAMLLPQTAPEGCPAAPERSNAPSAFPAAVCTGATSIPESSDACAVISDTPMHGEHAHVPADHPNELAKASRPDNADTAGRPGTSSKPTPASWDSYSCSPPKMQDFAGLPGVVAYQAVYEDATFTDTTASPLPSQLTASQLVSDSVGDHHANTPTSQLGPASGILSSADLVVQKSAACTSAAEASNLHRVHPEAFVVDGSGLEPSKCSEPAAQAPTASLPQTRGGFSDHVPAQNEASLECTHTEASCSKDGKVGVKGNGVVRLPSLKAALAQCKSALRQSPPKLSTQPQARNTQQTEAFSAADTNLGSTSADEQLECAAQEPPCLLNTSSELQNPAQHSAFIPGSNAGSVVLLLRLDSFFCQVEVKDNPDLAGAALAIQDAPGGPLLACSSEAQSHGVHCTEGPVNQADILTRCPHLVLRPPRRARYTQECTTLLAALQNLLEGSSPISDSNAGPSPSQLFETPDHSAGCTVQASDCGSFYFNVTSACARASRNRGIAAGSLRMQQPPQKSRSCEDRREESSGHASSSIDTILRACTLACETDIKQFSQTANKAGSNDVITTMHVAAEFDHSVAAPTWENVPSDLLEGCKLAVRLTQVMQRMHGYNASVGVSRTRLLSRLLLRMAPCQAVRVLPPCRVHAFMACIPLTLIPALAGKAGADIRKALEIQRVGELEKWSERELAERFGSARARMLKALVQGGYDTGVDEGGEGGSVGGLGKVAVEQSYQAAERPETVVAAVRPLAQSLLSRLERCVSAQKRLPVKLALEWRKGIDATQYKTIPVPARVCARLRPLLHSDTTAPASTTNIPATTHPAGPSSTEDAAIKSTSNGAAAGWGAHKYTPTKTPEILPSVACREDGGDGVGYDVDGPGLSVHGAHASALEAIVAAVSSQIGATVNTANSIARISICATFEVSTSATPDISQQRLHSFLTPPSGSKQPPNKTPIKALSPASKLRAFFQTGSARTPSKPSCSDASAQQPSPQVELRFLQSSQEQLSPAAPLQNVTACCAPNSHDELKCDPPVTGTAALRTKHPAANINTMHAGAIAPCRAPPTSPCPPEDLLRCEAPHNVSTPDAPHSQSSYLASPSKQKQSSPSRLPSLKSLKSKLVQQLSPQSNPDPSPTAAQPQSGTKTSSPPERTTAPRKSLDHLLDFAAPPEPPLLPPTKRHRRLSPLKPPAGGLRGNEQHTDSVPPVHGDSSLLCIDAEPIATHQVQASSSPAQHAQNKARKIQSCAHRTQVLSNASQMPGLDCSSSWAGGFSMDSNVNTARATMLKHLSDEHADRAEPAAPDVDLTATGVDGCPDPSSTRDGDGMHPSKSLECLEPACTASDKVVDDSVEAVEACGSPSEVQATPRAPPEACGHTQEPMGTLMSTDDKMSSQPTHEQEEALIVTKPEQPQSRERTAQHMPTAHPIVDMCNEVPRSPVAAPSSGGQSCSSQTRLNLTAQKKVLEDAVRGAHAQRLCGHKGAAQNGALDVDMRLALRMQEEELARGSLKKGGPSPTPVRASTAARSGVTKKPSKSSRQSAASMKQLEAFFGGRSKK